MANKTYYDILGVSTKADAKDIRKAYLSLARQYHPDQKPGNKDDAEIFSRITKAYSNLSNIDSKYAYDLELGLAPGKESTISVEQRIELAPVTGTDAGDYMEEISGGIKIPGMRKVKTQEYDVIGMDSEEGRKAYEIGIFSIKELETTDMHRFYLMGVQLLRERDYDRACAYLEEAVGLNGFNLQYRFVLGCCYEGKEQMEPALEQYKQALKLGESKALKCRPVREAIISVSMRIGQLDAAEQECERMSELGIESSSANTVLKQIHKARQDGQN